MDILLVDDDLPTRKMLRFILEHGSGYRIHEAETPFEAAERVRADDFDLLLVDVMMPGLDGFELCKQVRATSNVPIMIVSARGDIPSRVRGLQLGADDFLVKPFDPSELAARVEALMRRTVRASRATPHGVLRVGDLTLDLAEHRVEVRAGRGSNRRIDLTPTEFKLLLVLARSPGEAVTRAQLQEALWGPAGVDPDAGYNTINAYVSELRARLEPNPRRPRYLVTVRGVGYRLDP